MPSARKHKQRQRHGERISLQLDGPAHVVLASMTPAQLDATVIRALRRYVRDLKAKRIKIAPMPQASVSAMNSPE